MRLPSIAPRPGRDPGPLSGSTRRPWIKPGAADAFIPAVQFHSEEV